MPFAGTCEDTTCSSNHNNNKVTRASAAARGVSFIFGCFFGQKLENIGICVVFAEQQDVSIVFGV